MKQTGDTYQVIDLLPHMNSVCRVIKGVFSEKTCTELLTPEMKNSFQEAITHYPNSYRNNDRLVYDNEALGQTLFEYTKAYLPSELLIHDKPPAENGQWELYGLNPRIRFCRYTANQYFSRHRDGVYFQSETIQSKLTFLIYLNGKEGFSGGRTLFYADQYSNVILAEYTPERGDLIIFDHHLWHAGETIGNGTKYILRSDILFREKESSHLSHNSSIPFVGHLGYVWKLLCVENDYLLSSGRDKSIKIWDRKGRCIHSQKGHENSILSMELLAPDLLATGSRDQTIKLWKIDYGQKTILLQKTIDTLDDTILCLEKLSDKTFASSGSSGIIRVFDIKRSRGSNAERPSGLGMGNYGT